MSRVSRPDSAIFADARLVLDGHPDIPHTVRLHVEAGVVTLTGSVRTAAEQLEAEHIVRGILGVTRVVNAITVARSVRAEGFEPPADNGTTS